MKNYIIVLFIAIFYNLNVHCQKLVENRIDEFTNDTVKNTSWELIKQSGGIIQYFRLIKINSTYIFNLKMIVGGKVYSIDKNAEIMFKMSNNEIIKITNNEYTIACVGCGSRGISGSALPGTDTKYIITKDQILSQKVCKVSLS